ncbi:glycosyltransferase family 39 protein [Streptomyces sp. JH14]|uniref:glycosyltransferase family 39 protein n=1 Tax=Streptomyces sp. JH14 TaxID=2793630 RepID=UPI0023F683A2|nr:glycosyltransferase family 39 protein [Streptomyces sp. JH14]MDF6043742.1 glycosyltransferase family 39 protein [Streptomyces sp. JH14]
MLSALTALLMGLWGVRRENSMWRDESVTYQVAHRSPDELWQLLGNTDAVHGLYYFFMHAMFAVGGDSLVTLRLPSVLATSVSAFLVARTGSRLAGPRAGCIGGLAFALIPVVQMYAQEGRSYALVCALVALSTHLFAGALDDSSRGRWTAYALTVIVAGWLHEFALLALPAHGLTLYLSRLPRPLLRSWAVAAGVSVAAVAPLAVRSAGQSGQVSWIGWPRPAEWLVVAAVTLIGVLCAVYVTKPAGAAARAGGLRLVRLALPLLIVPPAALLLASLHDPVYLDRYVLYSHVGLALLIGLAADRLWEAAGRTARTATPWRRATVSGVAAVGVVAALLPVTLQMRTPDSRKDDVTAIAAQVRAMAPDGAGVLFMPSRRREWALSYPDDFRGLTDLALRRSPTAGNTLEGTEDSAGRIRARLRGFDRIVALSDPPGQPEDAFPGEVVKRDVLRQEFVVCRRVQVKGGRVTLYARPGRC